VAMGIILIACKKVPQGFAFFSVGAIAPTIAGLALIGLVPNSLIAIFWFLSLLAAIGLIEKFLTKKWKGEEKK